MEKPQDNHTSQQLASGGCCCSSKKEAKPEVTKEAKPSCCGTKETKPLATDA